MSTEDLFDIVMAARCDDEMEEDEDEDDEDTDEDQTIEDPRTHHFTEGVHCKRTGPLSGRGPTTEPPSLIPPTHMFSSQPRELFRNQGPLRDPPSRELPSSLPRDAFASETKEINTAQESRVEAFASYSHLPQMASYSMLLSRQREARYCLIQAQWRDDFEARFPNTNGITGMDNNGDPQIPEKKRVRETNGYTICRHPRRADLRRRLESLFAIRPYPTDDDYERLMQEFGDIRTGRQIRQWFASKRYNNPIQGRQEDTGGGHRAESK